MRLLTQESWKHLFLVLLAVLVLLMLVILALALIADIFLPEYLIDVVESVSSGSGPDVLAGGPTRPSD